MHYNKSLFQDDLIAGIVVAIMLVPQAMAYALLAGMPPQTGLYACILPIFIYAALGTSNYLAIGPVAIIAMMVAGAAGLHAQPGEPDYISIAILLAALSGFIMILFGFLGFGRLVNFLSYPVINGFINAAALVIAASQLKHLLGIEIPPGHSFLSIVGNITQGSHDANPATIIISAGALCLLYLSRRPLAQLFARFSIDEKIAAMIARTGALGVVLLATVLVWRFDLHTTYQVAIVGRVPAGLPSLTWPALDHEMMLSLLPGAALIAVVSFIESISIARSLAGKRRERIKPNRELVAIGSANVAASLSGAFPVAGGVSRSGVNYSSGAKTRVSSVITALIIIFTILFFAPLFYYLPVSVLAAIVCVAVFRLIDVKHIKEAWRFNRADALSSLATFFAVLLFGIEQGLLIGAGISIILYILRTTRPHIAIVGRLGNTEHYRNVKNYTVTTCRHVVGVRIDESLYFANVHELEDRLLQIIAEQPEVEHVVLICSAINFIDLSALRSLEATLDRFHDAGVVLHLSEVKIPVMKMLKRSRFLTSLKEGKVYISTHEAMTDLGCV